MTTFHVLTEPSGAYQCLENSLVCSHLESLITRIRVSMTRGDRTQRADEAKWLAFWDGALEEVREASLGQFGRAELIVRATKKNLIMQET